MPPKMDKASKPTAMRQRNPHQSCPNVSCKHCRNAGYSPINLPYVPYKHRNSKDCPMYIARKNERLGTASARYQEKRGAADSAEVTPAQGNSFAEDQRPDNDVSSTNDKEDHASPATPKGKRGPAEETSFRCSTCYNSGHQNRHRANVPREYCHKTAHLLIGCSPSG